MIAAIYARKSNEQQGVGEEEKSVQRQIDHAKDYAVKKGWTVKEEAIYVDDGISGVEFVKRPGFIKLMSALKPKPPFQVLIMSEESRLGRESIESSYAFKQIMDAGVRVFFYLEDRERTLDNALDKMMLSLAGFASEVERERCRQRTADALKRKAQLGHVTGGKVYGYDNVEVYGVEIGPDGKPQRLHTVLQINPEQAEIIRRIYQLYAKGWGVSRIAKHLNNDHIPAPRKAGAGWAPSAIWEILHRSKYWGVVIYNMYENVYRGGTIKRVKRPEDEWIVQEAPHLRIISPELEQVVKARIAENARVYTNHPGTGQLIVGRPGYVEFNSPYLMTGLMECGYCGGSMVAITRERRRTGNKFYGCKYHQQRGNAICKNSLEIQQDRIDQVVLEALNDILDERILGEVVETAVSRLQQGRDQIQDRQAALEADIAHIDANIQKLVQAIMADGESAPHSIVAQMKVEETRKQSLLDELALLKAQSSKVVYLDQAKMKQDLNKRVKDMKGVLGRHKPQARQIIRKLIDGKLVCTPVEVDGVKGYQITGQGSYHRFLPSALVPMLLASPTGFKEDWNFADSFEIKKLAKAA